MARTAGLAANAGRWWLALSASMMVASAAIAGPQTAAAQEPRRSGFDYMGKDTQAMQQDDSLNPALLWVKDGEALWQTPAGRAGKACVSCHAAASSSMKGVTARYPSFDQRLGRPITLGQRVNQCRQVHQQAGQFKAESQELLSLESYLALQSRGLLLAPPADPRLDAFRSNGEQLFKQRMGQLNLSCAQCHDANAGRMLGASVIPQAHPTAYPIYRLEWQALGSLQRRLRNCMSGIRAEPFAYDSQDLVNLELYLANRASGMVVESPGVRP